MLNSYSENELSNPSQNQERNTANFFKLTDKDNKINDRKKYSLTNRASIYKPRLLNNLNRSKVQHKISFIVKGNSFILN